MIVIFAYVNTFSQNITPLDTAVWSTNYQKSYELSIKHNLPMIMVFSGSDWCKSCIKLREQILVSPEFSEWANENAVCLSVDFPSQKKNQLSLELRAQNDSLAKQFNKNGVFPLVLIFSEGEVIGNLGYKDITPQEYITKLENIIKN